MKGVDTHDSTLLEGAIDGVQQTLSTTSTWAIVPQPQRRPSHCRVSRPGPFIARSSAHLFRGFLSGAPPFALGPHPIPASRTGQGLGPSYYDQNHKEKI